MEHVRLHQPALAARTVSSDISLPVLPELAGDVSVPVDEILVSGPSNAWKNGPTRLLPRRPLSQSNGPGRSCLLGSAHRQLSTLRLTL